MPRKPAPAIAEGRATDAFVAEVARAGDAGIANKVQLFPIGTKRGRDGQGPYVVADRAHQDAIIAATMARLAGADLVIDYDHQTVFAAKDGVGGTAPAAGWVTRLEARDDGIWGDVEWTPAAQAKLAGREYRYISPVFTFDKVTGRVGALLNAALTNFPNLELAAVASQDAPLAHGDDAMSLVKIAAVLGLAATATEDDVLGAIAASQATATAMAAALNIEPGADVEAIATAAAQLSVGGQPDPAKFVPIAVLSAANEALGIATAKLVEVETKATAELVEAAIASGKLLPAQRDWGITLAKSNVDAFKAFVAATPGHVLTEQVATAKGKVANDDATDEELAIASQLGVSKDAFTAAKQKVAA